MDRRQFLKMAGLATAATLAAPAMVYAQPVGDKNVGVQLYTIRDAMKADAKGSIKKVAEMGYKWVEPAGYSDRKFYGMTPKTFKAYLADLGMTMPSSHSGMNVEDDQKTLDRVKQTAEDALEAGAEYWVQPYMPQDMRDIEGYQKAAEVFNRWGEISKKAGIKFAYHNHAFEFDVTDGQIPYDILLDETQPDLVYFQLDLFWITKGGQDPLAYFKRHPGRFELWHIKDGELESEDRHKQTPVGMGTMDFKPIFKKAKKSGMNYFFVEQDRCPTYDPLEAIALSCKYLREARFVK